MPCLPIRSRHLKMCCGKCHLLDEEEEENADAEDEISIREAALTVLIPRSFAVGRGGLAKADP